MNEAQKKELPKLIFLIGLIIVIVGGFWVYFYNKNPAQFGLPSSGLILGMLLIVGIYIGAKILKK